MPATKPQKVRMPNGEVVTMYYICTLAEALGRSTRLIRKWEVGGVIPPTCFKDKYGRRMYTKEMIDAIVESAEKAKIMQGKSIVATNFSKNCYKRIEVILKEYKERFSKKEV